MFTFIVYAIIDMYMQAPTYILILQSHAWTLMYTQAHVWTCKYLWAYTSTLKHTVQVLVSIYKQLQIHGSTQMHTQKHANVCMPTKSFTCTRKHQKALTYTQKHIHNCRHMQAPGQKHKKMHQNSIFLGSLMYHTDSFDSHKSTIQQEKCDCQKWLF